MTENEFIIDTKRHLPHKQLPDCVLFITWRLAFTLPDYVYQKLSEQRKVHLNESKDLSREDENAKTIDFRNAQFHFFDNWIDNYKDCQHDLSQEPYLSIVSDVLKYDNGKKYAISSYCIMPNHVHLVIKPLTKETGDLYTLPEIMETIKKVTAHKINKAISREGRFWQQESYDRIIRDEAEYLKTCEYVIMNPVKAGLVQNREDWAGTYLCKELR